MRKLIYSSLILLVMCGCGGGGSSPIPTPTPAVVVTLSPIVVPAVTSGGGAVGLTATVSNDAAGRGVSWSLSPATGCGSLTGSSSLATSYLPPATLASPCKATVTATSITDATKSTSVQIQVNLPPIGVTLQPETAQSIVAGTSLTVDGSVSNDPSNAGVTWSVVPSTGCGLVSGGTSTSATYVAPVSSSLAAACTATVSATSIADTSKSASVGITVTPIAVGISPVAKQLVGPGSSVTLTGSVTNDEASGGVVWTLQPATGCGSLSASSGESTEFTAPTYETLHAGCTATVVASSASDGTKSASTAVSVTLLPNWFAGGIAGKKILYWGNSTVANNAELLMDLGKATAAGGALEGIEFRRDLQGVQSDGAGNVTITLSAPPTYRVGQWVSVWLSTPALDRDYWGQPSVQVTAVSGNTFSYVVAGAPASGLTAVTGYVSGAILNFGNNGATLACLVSGCGLYPLAAVCAEQPDLLILRGPLINDVRLGATDLSEATALEKAALEGVQACSPLTSILLTTENSLLSTDTGEHWVQPNSEAQAYTDIMHDGVMAMDEQYGGVQVLDIMSLVYGRTVQASSQLMRDQLHENNAGADLEIQAILPIVGKQ